jgi:cell wall-associated NlpC family hydrolase
MYDQTFNDQNTRDRIVNRYKWKSFYDGLKLDFYDLKPGDHIYIICDYPIYFEHHGIYIGNNKVIHFQN